jgi:hypothetical protein
MLSSLRPVHPRHLMLCVAALAGTSITVTTLALARPASTRCAPDLDLAALSPRARDAIAHRVVACGDLARGDLTRDEYRARVAKIDATWEAPQRTPPQLQWASTVRGVSSEYTANSWSASHVLGPPDVFPGSGDNVNAWASLGADTGREWIEVGFAQPTPISAVQIFETLNPGAIDHVELITASGVHVVAFAGTAAPRSEASRIQQVDVACTKEPIVGVRVELASEAVPGWNELDAIGIMPCAD